MNTVNRATITIHWWALSIGLAPISEVCYEIFNKH